MNQETLSQLQALLEQDKFEDILPAAEKLAGELSVALRQRKEAIEAKLAEQKAAEAAADEGETAEATETTEPTETEASTPEAVELTPEEKEAETLAQTAEAAVKAFQEKKHAWQREVREEEKKNLMLKKELIAELGKLVADEENIGKAFSAHKSIHERWSEVGNIPRKNYQDIQAEYSKLNEQFYYNIGIYKELREHDLRRNSQKKKDIIAALDGVIALESIRETEAEIKRLQAEWEGIGPTFQEEWEGIKEAYWTKAKEVYKKIQLFYDDRKASQAENLAAKKALLEKAEAVVNQANETPKDWEAHTKELIALQAEWKTIGFAARAENEAVWKAFRAVCDDFFNRKKEHYSARNEVYDANRDRKRVLVDKANELKDSTDWKETSNAIIRLQKDWKAIGSAGQRNEHKLWKQFRGACDHFFDAKKAHYAKQDEGYKGNLTAKEELIKKIEAYKPAADAKETIDGLKAFSAEFNAIGHVPRDEKDRIYKAYKAALDVHYDQLDMGKKEKEAILFQAKLDQLQQSANPGRMLDQEREHIRKDINKLQDEILQYENNLGFFANSKGAEKIIADVQKKIDKNKGLIDELKAKMKLIPYE